MPDDPPPNACTLQETADQFYLTIGQCIAGWASVDDALFNIFQYCVGPREQSAIIYYRIQSLSVRFDLTEELVKSALPKQEKTPGSHLHASVRAWRDCRHNVQELLAIRSRIAHHPVGIHIQTRGGLAGGPLNTQTPNSTSHLLPPLTWFEIHVNQHESLREKSAALPSLELADLRNHLAEITALRDRLNQFFGDVLTKQFSGFPPSTPLPSSQKSQG